MCRPPMAGENAHSAFVGGPNVAKVDSCGACRRCEEGDEMFCESGYVSTYNGLPRYGNCQTDSGHTYGGYSAQHTVPER